MVKAGLKTLPSYFLFIYLISCRLKDIMFMSNVGLFFVIHRSQHQKLCSNL